MPVAKESVRSLQENGDLFNVLDFEPAKEQKSVPAKDRRPEQDKDDLTGQQLTEFYKDSVLLITGGTGFLGRILLQKLLRTFPIKRIYLLVRKKDTQSVEERMDELFQDVVRLQHMFQRSVYSSFSSGNTICLYAFRSLIKCEWRAPTSGK